MASRNLLRRIATTTQQQRQPTISTSSSVRTYVTRAHPSPLPTAPIQNAIESLLAGIETRHQSRTERWEKNKDSRVDQFISYVDKRNNPSGLPTPDEIRDEANSKPYRRMDETIELALQLNLDPRKPGQSLRGSLSLPHGNGKSFQVAVFTSDVKVATAAKEAGAIAAGGEELIESIQNGTTSISGFERTLASPEMMSQLAPIARLLGPRGLMPNPKLNTIIKPDDMLDALQLQMSGVSNYRTDKEGIVRLGIGKGSFGTDKLLDNIREMMNEIQSVKPESFGKGKKGQKKVAKGTKYYLKAHLSSTQSKGSLLVDMRTLDPTSSFFMSDIQ